MTILGRHVFYDYPDYYNLFSRITADAGGRTVYHTNRKLLRSYRGADGIKTGYTRAAGFNLVASAERGGKRVIATVFGGRSTASRNAKVAELLDLGFNRVPSRVALHRPRPPAYMGKIGNGAPGAYGRTVRLVTAAAVKRSLRPQARRVAKEAPVLLAAKDDIEQAVLAAQKAAPAITPAARPAPDAEAQIAQGAAAAPATNTAGLPRVNPEPRPSDLVLASVQEPARDPIQEVVTRVSTSGGRNWGINVGRYPSEYKARKILLQTALNEISTLDGSLRKVVKRPTGFDANFMGMNRETADLACRRLQAKKVTCFMIEPGGGA